MALVTTSDFQSVVPSIHQLLCGCESTQKMSHHSKILSSRNAYKGIDISIMQHEFRELRIRSVKSQLSLARAAPAFLPTPCAVGGHKTISRSACCYGGLWCPIFKPESPFRQVRSWLKLGALNMGNGSGLRTLYSGYWSAFYSTEFIVCDLGRV